MKTIGYVLATAIAFGLSSVATADHHLKLVDLTGVWNVMASTEEDVRELSWTFKKDGDKYSGISQDHENGDERKLDRITVKEKKVILEIDLEVDGNKGMIKVEAEEKGSGKLVGKWSIVGEDGNEFMSGDITAKKQVAFAGEWDLVAELPDGAEIESLLTLKGKNDALKGTFDGDLGETKIEDISAKDNELRMEFDLEIDGDTVHCVIEAEAKGNNELEGEWVAKDDDGDEIANGEMSAKRKPVGLAGTWKVVAAVPNDGEYNGTLTLTNENGKYAGTSKSDNGEPRALKTISVDDKKVKFTVPFERDEYTGTITIEATIKGDSLVGEWILTGSDGDEYARDEWKATRQ